MELAFQARHMDREQVLKKLDEYKAIFDYEYNAKDKEQYTA